MRRRISLIMVAMVVGALVFSGVITLGLTVLNSINQTRSELLTEANGVAQGINQEIGPGARAPQSFSVLLHVLAVLKAPLNLQNESVLAVRENGTFYNPLSPKLTQAEILPSGVRRDDIYTDAFIGNVSGGVPQPVSGHVGRLVWVAQLLPRPIPVDCPGRSVASKQTGAGNDNATSNKKGTGRQSGARKSCQYNLMVLLTRQAPTGLGNAAVWFGFAALVTVIVALLVANRLGHRIARPLQLTQAVTHRIASGDLNARAQVTGKEGPELVSLAESVNQMAASLSRAQRAQRQFLMSVSHDLRTPLTSVRGYAEALVDGTTQDVTRASEVILSEARRLERLVGDLLELAKLEGGSFSLDCGPVDLAQVAAEMAMAFEPEAERLGLRIELAEAPSSLGHGSGGNAAAPERRPEPLICYADADRLAQVVANLVENALKYASTRVLVSARSLAGRPALCVEDDGPGIPAEDIERVFTRLYQSPAAASRKVGSGLGLAIVDELVQAMGGRAWAESPVGPGPGGARMWVALAPRGAREPTQTWAGKT